MIRLETISKSYGDVAAVDDVSLHIKAGEFFCLLGPSGCGKTSLLRIIAGLETQDSGRVAIDGADMAGVDPAARPVNIMFQNYALFPHYSVADNIAYGLRCDGVSGVELDNRIAAMLKLVRLEKHAARKPNQLSGGESQRVALARALARQPKVLLLDEPLAALDKKLREESQFQLVDIQSSLGTTFIVVTHDQEEAMVLADRIGVMDKGRLVQVGAPKELYENPHNRFVADFLGSVSFLEGVVQKTAGKFVLLDVAGNMVKAELPEHLAGAPPGKGTRLPLAIRPEKITLQKKQPPRGVNHFSVRVDDIAFTGVANYYRVHAENGVVLKIHQQNLRETPDITWDETAHACFNPESVIILPE